MKINPSYKQQNETEQNDEISNARTKSVRECLQLLDAPQRIAMAVYVDMLQDLECYLEYHPTNERIRGHTVELKPLAGIRWYLTNRDGGELLADSLGLELWPVFRDKALPILVRAEAINPHLAGEYDYSHIGESHTPDDDDDFSDIELPTTWRDNHIVSPNKGIPSPFINPFLRFI